MLPDAIEKLTLALCKCQKRKEQGKLVSAKTLVFNIENCGAGKVLKN